MVRAVAVVLFLASGACEIGVVEGVGSPVDGIPDPDAGNPTPGGGGGGGDAGAPDGTEVAADDCDEPVLGGLPSGHHNAGAVCLNCHDGNGAAPRWTAAGTIYTTIAGTAPLPGATIHLVDADGVEVVLLSATNGNFWTTQDLAFPLTAKASRCPDTQEMPIGVQLASASCNKGGCHDADMRIALP
jgi:hypothetical protein